MNAISLARPQDFALLALTHGRAPTLMQQAVAHLGGTILHFEPANESQRNLFATRIDRFVTEADRAVLLIANGAACMAAAWWARLSPAPYVERVAGAVMLEPSAPGSAATRGLASPSAQLPFPSVTLGNLTSGTLQQLAAEWGSQPLVLDAPEDRIGGRMLGLIERWSKSIVARDLRTARRMIDLNR